MSLVRFDPCLEAGKQLFIVSQINIVSRSRPARGGYSHTLPIQVCAAQWGRDFEAPDLEWGIHFRGVF